ncbi:exosome complex protein Rrp42 [Candidatus Woesearchaeota archaeon]|nr:exosome complex protein Rrp42 [Candidatus Woesearchaeota archaeon]
MNHSRKSHIIEYLNKDTRYDGRKLLEFRKFEFKQGIIKTAEGSAWVRLGDTEVIAGVKFELGQPYPDIPEEGTMMVNVELLPLSSPEFEPGPPGEWAVEVSRVVDRGIRESKVIDTRSLCVEKGKLVWNILIDICPINEAGNLLDVSGIAAYLALEDAKFPDREDDKVDYKKLTNKKLKLSGMPIPISVLKIGDKLIVDPIPEEESILDARLTVCTLNDKIISALQKGGGVPLNDKDISEMIDIAFKKAKEIRLKINKG